jgi:hypothetical protein
MRTSRISRRTVKRQNRKSRQNRQNRKNRKQRGGKIVLPMEYFGGKNNHYSENPTIAPEQIATSHGVPIAGQQMTGPDLRIAQALKQQGGGVLPAEYFGGNSGRYFEEGAPELANCESAYGTIFPSSHGVVMPGQNSQWMGPNLASFPNATKVQTGGSCPKCGFKRGGGKKRTSKRSSKRTSKRSSKRTQKGGTKHNCKKCGVKCTCGKVCKCKKGCKGKCGGNIKGKKCSKC